MRLDDVLLWLALGLSVALFASLQYDPCNQYTDGTDMFLQCETGAEIDLAPMKGE